MAFLNFKIGSGSKKKTFSERGHTTILDCLVNITGKRVFKFGRGLLVGCAYVLLVAAVSFVFLRTSGINVNRRANIEVMLDGSAHRPFVYRVLLPTLATSVTACVPNSIKDKIVAKWDRSRKMGVFKHYFRVESSCLFEGVLIFGFMVLSLLGYALFLQKMSIEILGTQGILRHLAPLLGLLALPPFFTFGYIYDFPVLFLSCCCFFLIFKEYWLAYLVVFLVACFNKETTILFAVVFGAYACDRLEFKRFLVLGFLQVIIFAVVRSLLVMRFSMNPGGDIPNHLIGQLDALLVPVSYSAVVVFSVFLFLMCFMWSEKPPFLKRALWVAVPLVLLFILGGCPGEYRVFYEVLPLIILMVSHTLVALIGAENKPVRADVCTTQKQ